jgi:hypothetical protein
MTLPRSAPRDERAQTTDTPGRRGPERAKRIASATGDIRRLPMAKLIA